MAAAPIDRVMGVPSCIGDGFIATMVLAPEGSGPPGAAQRPLRLLIVEDDYFTAIQNESALAGMGYEVVGMAGSFEEAVRIAGAERPDLVVMDIRLAGPKDGVDAATAIMERFAIPSLFVSAYTDERTKARAEPAHPLGWLTKPFTVDQLAESVRAAADRMPRRER